MSLPDVVDAAPLRRNPPAAPWIVQKYGGTSVGKFLPVIGQEIVPSYLNAGNRLALVCSARSGESKSTGTTNLLLRAALEALRPRSDLPSSTPGTPGPNGEKLNPLTSQIFQRTASVTPGQTRSGTSTPASLSNSFSSLRASDEGDQVFNATVDQIKEDHIAAARKVIKDQAILAELEDDLDYDCERLRSFLLAAQIIDEISARSKDIIMGVGERLSCRIVTASLRDNGIDAELVSLENIVEAATEDEEAAASRDGPSQLSQNFYDRLSKRLGDRLLECGDRVPVITGFFGVVPGSLLAQVGRGYTDLCAALCAVGLSAAELQVWKEVDGIFTADPRKVPTARLLATITPEEAAELTYYGSEVIHPFTMEQVIRSSIPIRIKNVENPSGAGTVIFPDPPSNSGNNSDDETALSRTPTAPLDLEVKRGPTAVTIKDNTLMLSIRSNRKTISHGFFARIFGTLDKYGIIVDLISTSEVYVSMAINGSVRTSTLDRIVNELKVIGEVVLRRDMAILSLVGKHMKNMKGIAGKMFTVLAEGHINIEMISQGASEINISCVIEGDSAVKALNVVHHKLLSQATASMTGPWLY
ncbi:aspartate kinase [Pseudohyphozyma bogoriensis]|nr:aspartate kinase [Pseudohyphozyma bogoriensis]